MSCEVYILRLKLRKCISEASSSSAAVSFTQLNNVFGGVESYLQAAEFMRAQPGPNDELLKWVLTVCKLVKDVEKLVDSNFCIQSSFNESKFLDITSLIKLSSTEFISYGWSQITASLRRRSSLPSEKNLVSFSKKVIESHVQEIIADAMEMGLSPATFFIMTRSMRVSAGRWTQGPGQFDNLIGREKELKEIKNLITFRTGFNNVEILSMEGAAGVGKTAIAKAVFSGVKGEFDCYAWVVVSYQRTTDVGFLKDVIRSLFDSLSLIGPSNLADIDSPKPLEEMIRRCINRKNFLIVIDDISSVSDLLVSLLDTFPPDCGGKVLLTSRGINIPNQYNPIVYKIEPLKAHDSLELLRRTTNIEQVNPQLWPCVKTIAEEITEMCQYVPLSIKMISGLLSTRSEEAGWIEIRNRLSKSDFLPFCYAGMPPALKTCFLSASIFADHAEFSCKMLQRLWIAQDLIAPDPNLSLEDIANFWVAELIHRSFLHVVRAGMDGETVTFSLLRPIREFAAQRCIEDQYGGEDGPGIRCLFLRNSYTYQQILRSPDTSSFKMLTVLELGYLPINSLPELGNLALLQYLGLRGTKVKTLPKSIVKMRRLQSLDVRETMIVEMPSEIESLSNLRHLLLSGSFTDKVVTVPVNIEHFENIQTLAGMKLTQEMAKRLCLLPELRKLSVGEVRSEHSRNLLKSTYQMDFLRSLTIKCAAGERFDITEPSNPLTLLRKLRLGGQLQGLHHWKTMLNSLKYLYLWDSQLQDDPFSILKHLRNIVVLSLCNVYNGETIQIREADFPNLRKLSIIHFDELKEWGEMRNGALQSLEELTVSNCAKLEAIPKGLENLSRLKVLHCTNMPKRFIQTANGLYGRERNKTSKARKGQSGKETNKKIKSLSFFLFSRK